MTQMREEQKIVRQWAQSQTAQQDEMKRMMAKLGSPAAAHEVRASRSRAKEE